MGTGHSGRDQHPASASVWPKEVAVTNFQQRLSESLRTRASTTLWRSLFPIWHIHIVVSFVISTGFIIYYSLFGGTG